jgi:predicted phosphodiesterase
MARPLLRLRILALLACWSLSMLGWSAIGASDATPLASPVASPTAVEHWPSWVAIGPSDAIIARAVRPESCPQIAIDGSKGSMNIRALPTAEHPNVVCETTVPSGASAVSIDGKDRPLPDNDPQRIALLGDTGCRLKAPDAFQACNDRAQWPFARVAASAAAWDPDLVIHVGDYIYRESPCPADNAGCAGSPYGDSWSTWNADFFAPAGSLLDAAPWIFVRGNHEDCNREGMGWFRYLDPMPMPEQCQPYTEPYALTIGDVQAVVLDVASAQDTDPTAEVTKAFEPIFDRALALAEGKPTWLLTHRPMWSIGADSSNQPTEWSTATYDQAGFSQHSSAFDLVIAGHVHMAELVWFTPASQRAPQLIAGGGGTQLDDFPSGMFDGTSLDDPDLVQGWRWQAFGFMTIQPIDTGYVTGVRLLDGTAPATCLSVGPELTCLPS